MMDIQKYFDRIHFTGTADVSIETLKALHRAHVFRIPFENLDLHLGLKIPLDEPSLFRKMVLEKRGGYCYEMNGLFAWALRTIGFKIDLLAARMLYGFTEKRPLSHQLLLIAIGNERWICGVGYGRHGLIEPIPLATQSEYSQFSEKFRLRKDPDGVYVLQSEIDEVWTSLYAFTLQSYSPVDYAFMNYYNSTSPESPFRQKKICALPTPEGRKILTDTELKIKTLTNSSTTPIANNDHYLRALREHFGLDIKGNFFNESGSFSKIVNKSLDE